MILENIASKERVGGITKEGWDTLVNLGMAKYWRIVDRNEAPVERKKVIPKALIDFTASKKNPKKKQISKS